MGNGITPKSAYDANRDMNAKTQMYEVGMPVDRLTYDYLANSNKLKSVCDAANDPTTKLGDFRTSKYSCLLYTSRCVLETALAPCNTMLGKNLP